MCIPTEIVMLLCWGRDSNVSTIFYLLNKKKEKKKKLVYVPWQFCKVAHVHVRVIIIIIMKN